MAEATDLSRTEPPSPRRLQAARSAGDVPRSAEFARWVVLLAGLGVLGWLAARLLAGLQAFAASAFARAAEPLSLEALDSVVGVAGLLLPLLVAIFFAGLVAPLLVSGWTFAPQVTRVDLARASPFKPFSRLLSQDAWFDAFLWVLKLLLVAGAIGWALESGWTGLAAADPRGALHDVTTWVGRGVMAVALALALVAALDAGWRWWRYLRRHAMTRDEMLAEAREAELPPEVQAQLRARQQAAAQGAAGANAGSKTSPLPNPLPQAGEGANAGPKTIDEVIR